MPSLAAARAANAKFNPPTRPVAVFFGGTSGIGKAIVEALARYTAGRAHIILVGRNEAAAKAVILKLTKHPENKYEFVHCDATLMANVARTATDLLARLPKLNYLVLTAGVLSVAGFEPTAERIDAKLALSYYARFALATALAPLLERAARGGEDARVMSVLGAGHGGAVDLGDLGLERGQFDVVLASAAASLYTDCLALEYALRHPALSFTHAYPGFVATGVARSLPWLARTAIRALGALFAVTPETCAEHMFYALTDPSARCGAFFKDEKGDATKASKWAIEEARRLVWDHSEWVTTPATAPLLEDAAVDPATAAVQVTPTESALA